MRLRVSDRGSKAVVGFLAVAAAAFVVATLRSDTTTRTGAAVAAGIPFLIPIWIEFHTHFRAEVRGEIAIDVTIITAAMTCVAYLLLRPLHSTPDEMLSSLIFSSIAVSYVTGYGALEIWVP